MPCCLTGWVGGTHEPKFQCFHVGQKQVVRMDSTQAGERVRSGCISIGVELGGGHAKA